jgi:MerR family transcriptional regulator, light-induced transcriptional regulator
MKYLSPRTLARAVGVSESSLKRWADEGRLRVERTAGGHRRISLAEAVRFVRGSGMTPVRPDLLGFPALDDAMGEVESGVPAGERLQQLLLEDRAAESVSLIVALYLEGESLAWICDEVIRVALARIGELWEHDANGIFLEHRATETCAQALARLRPLLPGAGSDAPVALGGAEAGDIYQVPSAMAALIVAEAGYRERNLGADTPDAALLAAIRHHRPRLVWRSFSVPPRNPREAGRRLLRIAEAVESGSLVVGGRGAASIPISGAPNVQRLGSMAELLAFARGAAAPNTPQGEGGG